MKIVKPSTIGVLAKPYSQGGRHFLVIALVGFFRLGAGDRRFLAENLQWPHVAAAMPDGIPLDAVMPKGNAEWMLLGDAVPPGGAPARESAVSVTVGRSRKRLRIVGDRTWEYGLLPVHAISEPAPFTTLPLIAENAFGGEGHAENPDGKGYFGRLRDIGRKPGSGDMPNIEDPDDPVTGHTRNYRPQGFGPIDIRRPSRQKYAGTFDLNLDPADLPGDTDFRLFNCAAADQQRSGFWQGRERYVLEGVRADGPIAGELPQMRARAFVQRESAAASDAEAIECHCDTVCFLTNPGLGVAIYRGSCEIDDSDALDVASVMAAYEAATDAPRSDAYYRSVMQLRLDPETALQAAVNDAQLSPPPDEEARAKTAEQRARYLESIDAEVASFAKSLDSAGTPPSVADDPIWQAAPSPAELESGDVDLAPFMAEVDGRLAKLTAEAEKQRTLYAASEGGQSLPAVSTSDALDRAGRFAPELENIDGVSSGDDPQGMNRRLRRLAPNPVVEGLPDADGSLALRQLVENVLREGRPLPGRDLAGADLSGLDFRGCDLREVMLEGADLAGADFSEADLRGTVFTGATLNRCRFVGARMDDANLCGTVAAGAVFDSAVLHRTLLHDADLSDARLRNARLSDITANELRLCAADLGGASLIDCALSRLSAAGSDWTGSVLRNCMMPEADLEQAVFSSADLERSILFGASAAGSSWRQCRFDTVQLSQSTLDGADLSAARGQKLGLRDSSLQRGRLRGARFMTCDMGNACLDDSDARESWWHRSVLMGASLRRSKLRESDFYQSLCRKACLAEADLTAARFAEAETTGMDLTDAVISATIAPDQTPVSESWV